MCFMENNNTDEQFPAYKKICRSVAYILTILFAIVSLVTILIYLNMDMKGVKGKVIERTDTYIIAQTEYCKVALKENTAGCWVIKGDDVIFTNSVALQHVSVGWEYCVLSIMCFVSIMLLVFCFIPPLWFDWVTGKSFMQMTHYPTEL